MSIFQDVICTFCGCLCDDLAVEVESNTIVKVKSACQNGRNKLLNAQSNLSSLRVNGLVTLAQSLARIETLQNRLEKMATEPNFRTLYNEKFRLMSIGYNVSSQQRNDSYLG